MHKRCHFFDDLGRPRHRGCTKGSECHFVHPDNPLWDALPPSPAPHPLKSRPLRSPTSHHRERPRLDASPGRRRDSPPHSSRRNSYYTHDSSRHLHRSDPDSRRSHRDEYPPPTAMPPPQRSSSVSTTATAAALQYSPKPLSMIPPPIPPPPPPDLSECFNLKDLDDPSKLAQRLELTTEEKDQKWRERVRLQVDAVKAFQDHQRLNSELERFHRLTRTTLFLQQPEEHKTRLQAQVDDFEKRSLAAKKAHDDAIERLSESNTWPILKTQDGRGPVDGYKQLITCIAELKDTIAEMHTALTSIIAQRNAMVEKPAPPATPLIASIDPRTLKRRRLSNADVEMADVSAALHPETKQTQTADVIAADDLEYLNDKLSNIESRLNDFENSVTQHDADILNELDSRIDVKLEGFHPTTSQSGGLPPRQQQEPGKIDAPIPLCQFKEFEKSINTAGDEIGEVANDVASLLLQSDALKQEITSIKEENERLRAENAKFILEYKAMNEWKERNKKEVAAIMAALSAHLARSLSPPPSPLIVPVDHILKSVAPTIRRDVLKMVQPRIDELSVNVEQMLRTSREEVTGSLSHKIDDVSRLVNSVSMRVDAAGLQDHVAVR